MRGFLALGDSYTVGEGVAREASWPYLLRDRWPDLKPTVIAKTGWTSGDLLAAVRAESPLEGCSLATVMVGVNDQYRGLAIDQFLVNAGDLLDLVVAAAEHVVTVSIPDWSVTPYGADFDRPQVAAEIDRFNQEWQRLAQSRELPFVDITGISRAHPTMVAEDGLHPSREQHRLWSAEIALATGKLASWRRV